MTTKKILIGTSFLVFMLGITVEPQTPTPTPAVRECDVPTARQVDKKLKILAKPGEKLNLTAIKFAKDDDLLLGETVLALGNPFGLGGSVTKGILSSKTRRP